LPVPDDELTPALKTTRKRLSDEWRAQAIGDVAVKAEYWEDLIESLGYEERELERINVTLAEKTLATASADWTAWLGDEKAAANDPRSEALVQLIDQMPAKATVRAAGDALSALRLARRRWDDHSKDAIQRERILEEKVLEAEQNIQNEKRASVKIRQKCDDQEQTIQDLKATIDELQRPQKQVRREAEVVKGRPTCGLFRFSRRS
jgi:hypothetical protein